MADPRLAEYLSAAQRATLLEQLANQPTVLQSLSWPKVVDLYYYLRGRSMDGALQRVGRWSQAHPSPEPQFTSNFFDANGRTCRHPAVGMAVQ